MLLLDHLAPLTPVVSNKTLEQLVYDYGKDYTDDDDESACSMGCRCLLRFGQ